MGTGFALRVVVDLSGLPDQAKLAIQQAYAPIAAVSGGALPAEFPYVIDQRLIETLAEMGGAQKATALLGKGFKNFDQVAEVSGSGEKTVQTAQHKLPSADLPVLDVSVGELIASIADGPRVTSDATLARLTAQLDAVSDLFPAELRDAFTAVTDAINGEIDNANGLLDDSLGEVATTFVDTTDPVLGGLLDQAGLGSVADDPAQLATELQNVVQLPQIGDLLDGDLASVTALKNNARTEKKSDGTVVAEAKSKIAAVNALGLVKTGVINLESLSQADGTTGSAINTSDCSIADVSIGGATGVSFDGATLNVNGTAIPVPTDEVAAIKDVVDDVLATAGISVELCDVAQAEADQDGTSAAQRVSAFRVEFAPKAVADVAALGIEAGDELVSILIDPTVETSVAAQVVSAQDDEPSLPRTGAGQLATILVGFGLAGGALIARKRFS